MGNIGKISEIAALQVRIYAEKLLKEIKAEDFSTKPLIGNRLIDCNHPAFLIGHLSLYANRISNLLNLGLDEFKPSQKYIDLFLKGAKCENDPERKIYPHKDELCDFFYRGTDKVISLLKDITDEQMLSENTDKASKDRFPLLGGFINYLVTAHPNVHLGQISVWRRCMGLGPV